MNSSRRKLVAILEALGVPPSARRTSAPPAAPTCESLEGRQLLAANAGFGMGMMAMGGPADVAALGGHHRPVHRGNPGGAHHGGPGSVAIHHQVAAMGTMMGTAPVMAPPTMAPPAATAPASVTASTATPATADPASVTAVVPGTPQGMPGMGGGGPGDSGGQNPRFSPWAGNVATTAQAAGGASAPGMGGGSSGGFGRFGGGPGGFGGRGMQDSMQGMPLSGLAGDQFGGGLGGQDSGFSPPGGGHWGGSSGVANAQLETDLQKLRADEQAIHDKSQVTPAMQATVRNDVKTIKGAETTTPDPTAVKTLQDDTKAGFTNPGGPTDAQLAQVQTDQGAVYKSEGVSDGLIGKLAADEQAIKTASGVTDADRATLAADRAAIQADRAPKATTTTPVTTTASTTASPSTSTTTPTPAA